MTRSLVASSLLLAVSLFCGACSSTLTRVPVGSLSQKPLGPPRIDRAVDLGGLPVAERGAVDLSQSDKLYTPGEWVALYGQNLVPQSTLTFAGRQVAVSGGLSNGALLFRMPRGLAPGMQTLTVDNGMGAATANLATAIYAFGADTQGNALHLRRLGPEGEGFTDLEQSIELAKARYTALSPDGAFLYVLQEPHFELSSVPSAVNSVVGAAQDARDQGGPCELIIVHLGARGAPQKLGAVPLLLDSRPTAMAMSARGLLVIVQRKKLMILDATDALQLRVVAQMPLTGPAEERELIDAEFLGNGNRLAVLEAYANQVLYIDLSTPLQPRQLNTVVLARTLDQPFSIDLAAAADGQSLWVLQGPNLKLGGKRLVDGLSNAWSDVKSLQFAAAARSIGTGVAASAMLPRESLSRVVQLTLDGDELRLTKAITLPSELYPFFIQPDRDGSLYVSGINRTNPFADVQASLDGVLRLLQAVKNTVQLGAVIKIGTEDGRLTTVLQGMAIYYDLALLPSGQLLTSTMRLGPGYLPPRLTLDWGLELAGGPFTKLREVANTGFKLTGALERLLPPYRYERIGTQ